LQTTFEAFGAIVAAIALVVVAAWRTRPCATGESETACRV
jgi:hypothetical protein